MRDPYTPGVQTLNPGTTLAWPRPHHQAGCHVLPLLHYLHHPGDHLVLHDDGIVFLQPQRGMGRGNVLSPEISCRCETMPPAVYPKALQTVCPGTSQLLRALKFNFKGQALEHAGLVLPQPLPAAPTRTLSKKKNALSASADPLGKSAKKGSNSSRVTYGR